ncbi:MAG: hypothetical protein ABEJ25_05810 [Candidatus Bipolaricaulia bacterium]
MRKGIPFLKGHMGGNEIVLAPRKRFTRDTELETGLKVLERPHIGGDQLGLLYDGTDSSDFGVKILDVNSKDYLPMCGGLTQVLGKAVRETNLTESFGLNPPDQVKEFDLGTDMGIFTVSIASSGAITTSMDPFIKSVYERKVEKRSIDGVESFRVGDFFVTFEKEIRKKYPRATFSPLDEETKKTLIELQEKFRVEFSTGRANRDFAIIELREGESRVGRLIFPHNLSEELLEPSCGTGTVAVAVTLAERGLIVEDGEVELQFDSGGRGDSIGGPEVTSVTLEVEERKVKSARLSHSLVELLAGGTLYI